MPSFEFDTQKCQIGHIVHTHSQHPAVFAVRKPINKTPLAKCILLQTKLFTALDYL